MSRTFVTRKRPALTSPYALCLRSKADATRERGNHGEQEADKGTSLVRPDMVLQPSSYPSTCSIPTLYSTPTTARNHCQAYVSLSGGANPAASCR